MKSCQIEINPPCSSKIVTGKGLASTETQVLVGLLGGLGPASSAAFTQRMLQAAQLAGATKDEHHVPYVLFTNPTLPNARAAALGVGPSPQHRYAATFSALVAAGCTHVASINNTGHRYARQAARSVGVPFVDMVQVTAAKAVRLAQMSACASAAAPQLSAGAGAQERPSRTAPNVIQQQCGAAAPTSLKPPLHTLGAAGAGASGESGVCVGLLATDATVQMGLYHDAVHSASADSTEYRVRLLVPSAEQLQRIQDCIDAAKAGNAGETHEAILLDVIHDFERHGCHAVIAGCTELPLMLPWAAPSSVTGCSVPIIDPLAELASTVTQMSAATST